MTYMAKGTDFLFYPDLKEKATIAYEIKEFFKLQNKSKFPLHWVSQAWVLLLK